MVEILQTVEEWKTIVGEKCGVIIDAMTYRTAEMFFLGANQRAAGRFEKAIESLVEHRKRHGGRILPAPTTQLAAAYMQAGRGEKALGTVAGLLKAVPLFSLEAAAKIHAYRNPDEKTRFLGALRGAGVPETAR